MCRLLWKGACQRTVVPMFSPLVSHVVHAKQPICQPTRYTVWLAGTVQTALYGDFFYYYFKSWKNNERLKLPA